MEKILKIKQPAMNGQSLFVIGLDRQNPWKAAVDAVTPHDVYTLTHQLHQPVIATPHIGRHWSSNSAYPLLGVKIFDFTGNMSVVDREDEPSCAYIDGKKITLTRQQRVLSPYLRFEQKPQSVIPYADRCVATAHHRAKCGLFPGDVQLDTVLYNHPLAAEVLAILNRHQAEFLAGYAPTLFPRWVSADGTVRKSISSDDCSVANLLTLKQHHENMILHEAETSPEGPLVIKEALILLDIIRQISDSGNQRMNTVDVYHVSGVSMLSYCKDNRLRALLDRGYKILRRELVGEWPQYVRFNILPGSVFGIMPHGRDEHTYTEAMTRVFELARRLKQIDSAIAATDDRQGLIAEKKALKRQCDDLLAQARQSQRPIVSQYDGQGALLRQQAWGSIQDFSFRDLLKIQKSLRGA